MTARLPTPAERRALAHHLTLLAIGSGVDNVADLALRIGAGERSTWRYVEALEAGGLVTSSLVGKTRRFTLKEQA